MFLNRILEQKENKARGKKVRKIRLHASFAAMVDIYFGRIAGSHMMGPHMDPGVCLSHNRRRRLPRVKILPVKLTFAAAGMAAALLVDPCTSRAGMYGDSRWCAVTNQGSGALDWDCEYATLEDCTPAVLRGNRGFCAINPYWRAASDQN